MDKHCYKCKQNKDLSDFPKNKSKKDGLASECKVCNKKRVQDYAIKNPEKTIKRALDWQKINKEKHNINSKNYVKNNPEKRKETTSNYQQKNKEKLREKSKNWSKNNKHLKNSQGAKYRANKLKATPPWLNKLHLEEINTIYKLAINLTKETGIVHEVDHIIPLQGKNVTGLHVPWNLRVITASENRKKHNKLIET